MITVAKLPSPIRSGDWHDNPLKWTVQGPGLERQYFTTKAWALRYASLRSRAVSAAEAGQQFLRLEA